MTLTQRVLALLELAGHAGVESSRIAEILKVGSHELEPTLVKLVRSEALESSWRDPATRKVRVYRRAGRQ